MHAQSFVGMSKKEAQDLAEKSNMIFRLVSVDGENRLGYQRMKREIEFVLNWQRVKL